MSFQDFLPQNTSGSTSWTLTATEIISEALDVLGIGTDGEGVEAEYYERAINSLNGTLRHLQNQGLHLNTQATGALFVQEGQVEYVLENENCTEQYYVTTVDGDITAPTSTFDVTDASNINVDDFIGIYQDDKSIVWSTVTVVASNTITIADSLTVDVTDGNNVVTYTSKIRPVERILQYWRREDLNNDVPITMISRDDYNYLPNKEISQGQPNQAYYQRIDPNGKLFLWPSPDSDSVSIVFFDYERKIEDMRSPNDKLDLNRTYLESVVWTLALRLAAKFQVSDSVYQRVKLEQTEILSQAMKFDDEVSEVSFNVNRRG